MVKPISHAKLRQRYDKAMADRKALKHKIYKLKIVNEELRFNLQTVTETLQQRENKHE